MQGASKVFFQAHGGQLLVPADPKQFPESKDNF